ncbi:MAG: DUF4157 domain-containing protein [Chloroflexi bacterium]|nr:DUF4157 domain-containing protein [Chloroflexota bacterium]
MTEEYTSEGKQTKLHRAETTEPEKAVAGTDTDTATAVTGLQQTIGNRAVQRLLAQRSGDGSFELDDETESRINQERGGGQQLDGAVQAKMSDATGHDFSGVKVHTSSESDTLNRQLGAKAFTTGQDIFFRSGAYEPHSSGGQELLAHELTHVVQQSSGAVGHGSGMTVNAPGDAYEQEADAVSKTVMSSNAGAGVQRQTEDEDEEPVQMQVDEEEGQVQMQAEEEEEEEPTA